MKKTIVEIANEVIDRKLDIAEKYIEEKLLPLMDLGSPESYLGKKYRDWTPEDEKMARVIFGDQRIRELQIKHFSNAVKALEAEVEILEGK